MPYRAVVYVDRSLLFTAKRRLLVEALCQSDCVTKCKSGGCNIG